MENAIKSLSWVDFLPKRILLIQPDTTVANLIKYGLENQGYSVSFYPVIEDYGSFDLIIFESSSIHEIADNPIIHSNSSNTPVLHIVATEQASLSSAGHVECIRKPYDFAYLLQRSKTILSQRDACNVVEVSTTTCAFRINNVELYPQTLEIKVSDIRTSLKWREFHVFLALLQSMGQIVASEELQARLSEGNAHDRNALTRSVHALRKRISHYSDIAIETVPHIGYRLIFK